MSPAADGSIPPVRVPVVPWQQTFRPEERVRVINGGGLGTVIKDMRVVDPSWVAHDVVWVLLDAGDNPQKYTPGQLRRAS